MTGPLESQLLGQTEHAHVSFWHEVRALPAIDLLPAAADTTVADIGAGAGLLGQILHDARPRCRYTFYEPLDSLAELLTARHGDDARLSSPSDVGGADVVTMLDVIEHIDDDRAALADVVEQMQPGAHLVVTVPALPFLWSSWDEQLGHFRRYTTASLRAAVDGLPVAVTDCAYLFPELLPPALVRRVTRRRAQPGTEVSDSDFPELPAFANRILLGIGRLTYRMRRVWPAGTSAVLVARRR